MASPPSATSLLLAIAIAGLLAAPRSAGARPTAGEAFLCAAARSARAQHGEAPFPTFHPRLGVPVVDRFSRPLAEEHHTLDLRKPEAWCRPVRLDDAELIDELHGFEVYDARRTRRKPPSPPFVPVVEDIVGTFGTVQLRVTAVAALAVPTTATGAVGGTDPNLDHFACYDVRADLPATERRRVQRITVRTRDASRLLEIRKPTRVCVPASVRGEDASAPKHPLDLLCYEARLAREKGAPKDPTELLATRNDLGNEVLRPGSPRQLCVWAARSEADLPSPTPLPTFTPPPTPAPTSTPVRTPRPPAVRIAPTVGTGLVRDRVCFTAQLELPDGTTSDVTTTVLWRIADGAVAVPAGFADGQKCFVGVGIGATTVSARDPVTGLDSATTGGDATLIAEWPIYALAVSPQKLGMRLGSARSLTATALFPGDRSRNVTQHVQWSSADPTVALAANPADNRSRIEAVGRGKTVITATDPLSSVVGATDVAVGALRSLQVHEPDSLFPGETTELTTIAFYEEGFSDELTEGIAYESSDPSIASASPVPGEKGIVSAFRPGQVTINAIDVPSGIRSFCCGTVRVLGDLLRIDLDSPTSSNHLFQRLGATDARVFLIRAYATYLIPPDGRAARDVSGSVTWLMDADVAVTDGLDRDRMRVVPVGGGVTSIAARDPASGLTSPPLQLTVYERLDRVDVGTSSFDPTFLNERTIDIGESAQYWAHGFFDGANYLRLDRVQFVSSDPAIVAGGSPYVQGVAPGTVTISAIDEPTGVSSHDGGREAILHVRGALERIELVPHAVTMNLDQQTSLTAIGHYAGAVTGTLTQQLVYFSSDPTVVAADNAYPDRSAIRTLAPGVATVSAYDPVTNISSSDSGDDTAVTVQNEHLLRIVVSPSTVTLPVGATRRFTATGHFTSGLTQNITQWVEWSSSQENIARAGNFPGDRSRVDAVSLGVVVIAASDPLTGITATASGDDARLTVDRLNTITLAPATVTLAVGSTFSFTTTGSLDGGGTINLTQDAAYASSDPTVAVATNLDGNRSRVVAMAPGTATITAHRDTPVFFSQATDSNPVTVIVTAPE